MDASQFIIKGSKSDTVEWKANWEEANEHCKSQNDSLVSIQDIRSLSLTVGHFPIWSSVKGTYTPWIAYRGKWRKRYTQGKWIKMLRFEISNKMNKWISYIDHYFLPKSKMFLSEVVLRLNEPEVDKYNCCTLMTHTCRIVLAQYDLKVSLERIIIVYMQLSNFVFVLIFILCEGCYEKGVCGGITCIHFTTNTVGNCYFECKSKTKNEGGCAGTEQFYFGLQVNNYCIMNSV